MTTFSQLISQSHVVHRSIFHAIGQTSTIFMLVALRLCRFSRDGYLLVLFVFHRYLIVVESVPSFDFLTRTRIRQRNRFHNRRSLESSWLLWLILRPFTQE